MTQVRCDSLTPTGFGAVCEPGASDHFNVDVLSITPSLEVYSSLLNATGCIRVERTVQRVLNQIFSLPSPSTPSSSLYQRTEIPQQYNYLNAYRSHRYQLDNIWSDARIVRFSEKPSICEREDYVFGRKRCFSGKPRVNGNEDFNFENVWWKEWKEFLQE